MPITNEILHGYSFLKEMSEDTYFPGFLVEKGQNILVRLCEQIELHRPKEEAALYVLTHAATDEFNALATEFEEHDSEIETVARDCIGRDFAFISAAYGVRQCRSRRTYATRDWSCSKNPDGPSR